MLKKYLSEWFLLGLLCLVTALYCFYQMSPTCHTWILAKVPQWAEEEQKVLDQEPMSLGDQELIDGILTGWPLDKSSQAVAERRRAAKAHNVALKDEQERILSLRPQNVGKIKRNPLKNLDWNWMIMSGALIWLILTSVYERERKQDGSDRETESELV